MVEEAFHGELIALVAAKRVRSFQLAEAHVEQQQQITCTSHCAPL